MNASTTSETPIATLELLTTGGEAVSLRLDPEGVWHGNDAVLVEHLNDWYSPTGESGPARGNFGVMEAELAAMRFSGRLRLAPEATEKSTDKIH